MAAESTLPPTEASPVPSGAAPIALPSPAATLPDNGGSAESAAAGTVGETLLPATEASPVPSGAAPENADSNQSAPEAPAGQTLPAASQEAVSPGLTSTVGLPSAPNGDLSIKYMFINADPVVQGVMLLLLLASLACWVIIFEKIFIFTRISRNVMLFKRAAAQDTQKVSKTEFPLLTRSLAESGIKESYDTGGNEARRDYRERVERAMRAELSGLMDRAAYRVMFLATVGATSPFVGLFGTVWGIMHSFIGIAASGETTLAVVAPGIAEALFATAMGLVAAIPAVIAYNKITTTMKKITKEALSGIGFIGNRLTREHFDRLESEGV